MRNIREEIKNCKTQDEVNIYMKNNPITDKDIVEALFGEGSEPLVFENRLYGVDKKTL